MEQAPEASDKSAHAGCVADGTPSVEIALIHLCETETSDSMPPSVVADGAGRLEQLLLPEDSPKDICAPVQSVGYEVNPAAVPVVFWLSVGISAATIARSPTAPETPLGVAKNSFCVCADVAVIPSVPLVVIGLPLTVSHEGTVKLTLVTVPLPAAL